MSTTKKTNNKSKPLYYLTLSGIIAAAYAVLTYAAAALNLAYGPVQFRFSEALTILPAITGSAIPGLTIGCFLSNLASPLGPVDWIFGSLATLLAAILTKYLSKFKIKQIPFLAPLAPVVMNAIIIGLEITCLGDVDFSLSYFSWSLFWPNALYVGLGELIVCYVLGIPFYLVIKKIFPKLNLFYK